MAITPYHCYCCLSHRTGGMVGAIFTLLISAISACYYIWVLLEMLTRQYDFTNESYWTAVLVLHYFLIALTGIVFPLLALILFAGAYWYFEVPVAFFSIVKAFGSILELGAIIFFAIVFAGDIVRTDGLKSEGYIIAEIVWFIIRFIYDLHLVFATWALYQINSSNEPQKSAL